MKGRGRSGDGAAAPGADLDERLVALRHAAELARGRADADAVDAAVSVLARAGARLGLGIETTVVALAGPTGAGKSTLFNALAGSALVRAGVRRPTTSSVTAAIWGTVDERLLDYVRAATRHVVDPGPDAGLVLLDLPDFDSVEAAHRREVDRLVELVDLLVWVADPQKYADAALHDGYLRRLSGHRAAMVVVLNQSDRLDDRALAACVRDLGALLAEDGLAGLQVLPVSALTGDGLPQLRAEVQRRAAARTAAVTRLAADVRAVAAPLGVGCQGRAGEVSRADRERLVAALSEAAGVPAVVDAVGGAHRRAGRLGTGWPYARWLGRLRPDPLKRLRLGLERPDADVHTSLPRATPVQRAQVSSAVRTLAAGVAGELPEPWPRLVREAAGELESEVPERLDRAIAATELRPQAPRWWGAAAAGQKLLALVAAAGAAWLLVLAVLGYLQIDDAVPTPDAGPLPVPTALLAAGVLGGLLLALLARWVNGAGARRRARQAQERLHAQVQQAAEELVVAPVEEELSARERLCRAAAAAAA